MEEVSIYIHIPFCIRKCFYCDFLSGPCDENTQKRYVEALLREIELSHSVCKVKTVFLGGGTPSVVAPHFIRDIMSKLRECFVVDEDCEITMEINPGTVTQEKMREYKRAGINRLSIGLQSAIDAELRRIGRIHTFGDFCETYRMARETGFSNINIDLISALPEQNLEDWKETLEKVVFLNPEHISAYGLIIEEGTPFYLKKETLGLPSEEEEQEISKCTIDFLQKNGYGRYEVSNYAKEGYESRHNITYWIRGNYLGFGIGAASMMRKEGIIFRYQNIKKIEEYIAILSDREASLSSLRESVTELSEKDCMEEFMFLGLRMTEGISADKFYENFKKSISEIYGNVIQKQIVLGTMEEYKTGTESFYRLTEFGMDVSNVVLSEFLFD